MNAWQRELGIEKVKLIPDGNAMWTGLMNQLVTKNDKGFGLRSWRYACVIEDGVITKLFEEPGKVDDTDEDPYEVSYPENVVNWIRTGEEI
jgi:peroxiredoxin